MMLRPLLVSFLACLSFAASMTNAQDAEQPATIQVEVLAVEYPPFLGEKLPGQGKSLSVLRQHLIHSNIEIVPKFVPPGRAKYLMERGAWQASFMPPSAAATSQQVVIENAQIRFGLLRRHGEQPFTWNTLKELAGKTVAVTRTGRITGYYARLTEQGLKLFQVESIPQAVRLLAHERVDYVLTVEETAWYVVDTLGLDRAAYQFSSSEIDRFSYELYVNTEAPQGQALARALGAK